MNVREMVAREFPQWAGRLALLPDSKPAFAALGQQTVNRVLTDVRSST
jgi:hypothetical protein